MCENFIKRYRANDDVPIRSQVLNFAAKADRRQFRVTQCYKRALTIYCKFDKKDEGIKLLNGLLWLVDTCQEGTFNFGIQLLLSLQTIESPSNAQNESTSISVLDGKEVQKASKKRKKSKIVSVATWFDGFRPGTTEEVRDRLRRLIVAKLREEHMDFWLLRSASSFARSLAIGDHSIENDIDELKCAILPLEAHNSIVIGNLPHAESCYVEAATVAQQLGRKEQAEQFLQQASELGRRFNAQPPQQGSIEADLNQIMAIHIKNIISEQFLPTLEEIKKEYEAVEDKLQFILHDTRFIIRDDVIFERAKRYDNAGLLHATPSRDADQFNNLRTDFREGPSGVIRLLEITYVRQIVGTVGELFTEWQKEGSLESSRIDALLLSSDLFAYYDWRIFRQALNRHFERDYIGSVHLLIPQFENILRTWAERAGASVKKLDARAEGTVWGQKLLDDLLTSSEIKGYFGENVFKLIRWYLTASGPFGVRNRIAHGFIAPEQCNVVMSSFLIWLTLLIIDKPLPKPSIVDEKV